MPNAQVKSQSISHLLGTKGSSVDISVGSKESVGEVVRQDAEDVEEEIQRRVTHLST